MEVGVRAPQATTPGPVSSAPAGETAATGVMAARIAGIFPGSGPGAPPTAPAKTNGVMTAIPMAGLRDA